MDTMISRMPEMFGLFVSPGLLDVVGLLLGDELTLTGCLPRNRDLAAPPSRRALQLRLGYGSPVG